MRQDKREIANAVSHPGSSVSAPAVRQQRRVLVVDDDAGTLETFSLVLAQAGYVAVAASTASRALEESRRFSFDLALVDLHLNGSSGLATIRPLSPTPVIIVTGFGEVASAVEALKLGAADYVEKPLVGEELISVVERNLPLRRQAVLLTGLLRSSVGICEFAHLASSFRAAILAAEVSPSASGTGTPLFDTESICEARVSAFLAHLVDDSDDRLFWTESEWADGLGVDAAHLGRLIRRHSGRSFREWRRLARVRKASHLLHGSDEHVSQIGYSAGYGDCSQFRREFVQVMGLSPAEFRRLVRMQAAT